MSFWQKLLALSKEHGISIFVLLSLIDRGERYSLLRQEGLIGFTSSTFEAKSTTIQITPGGTVGQFHLV